MMSKGLDFNFERIADGSYLLEDHNEHYEKRSFQSINDAFAWLRAIDDSLNRDKAEKSFER
jgi:hypothetical protein